MINGCKYTQKIYMLFDIVIHEIRNLICNNPQEKFRDIQEVIRSHQSKID